MSNESRQERSPGLRMGRPFGIPVYVSPTWLIVAAFITYTFQPVVRAYLPWLSPAAGYAVAFAFAVFLYVSVLLHELAHCVVAAAVRPAGAADHALPARRRVGDRAGAGQPGQGVPRRLRRARCSRSASPSAASWSTGSSSPFTVVGVLVQQLWLSNLIVGVFNLLPGPAARRRAHAARRGVEGSPAAPARARWPPPGCGRGARGRARRRAARADRCITGQGAGAHLPAVVGAAGLVHLDRRLPGAAGRPGCGRASRRCGPARWPARRSRSPPRRRSRRRCAGAEEAGARAIVVADHEGRPVAIVNEAAVDATPEQPPPVDQHRRGGAHPRARARARRRPGGRAAHRRHARVPRPASTCSSSAAARCTACSPRPTSTGCSSGSDPVRGAPARKGARRARGAPALPGPGASGAAGPGDAAPPGPVGGPRRPGRTGDPAARPTRCATGTWPTRSA